MPVGSIGIHAASAAELPFDGGVGVVAGEGGVGAYLEGAYLHRLASVPKIRLGATASVNLFEHGVGPKLGITLERANFAEKSGGGTDQSNCTKLAGGGMGASAWGLYAEMGYTWFTNERNTTVFAAGVSYRFPAFFVAVYGVSTSSGCH